MTRICPGAFERTDWLVLAAIAATTAVTTVFATQSALHVGRWEDDGVYLATGKALAEGRGYRHIELPGEPYQTKYPILYPLALSVIWRLFPEFPAVIVPMQILNAVFGGAAAWLGYLLVRRAWGLPVWLAACAAMLVSANDLWMQMIRITMSEHLYTLLSMAALLVAAERPADGLGPARRGRWWRTALPAALLAGAAYLTRSIGVCLIAALLGGWLLRRRWREAAGTLVVGALFVGGWMLWRASAVTANATIPQVPAFRYDLDYSLWLVPGLKAVGHVAYLNMASLAHQLFVIAGRPSTEWVDHVVAAGGTAALPLYLLMLLFSGLCVAGLVYLWQRRRPTTHIYLALYLLLVLVWPFNPGRFLIPLLPLLMTAILLGIYVALASLGRLVARVGRLAQPLHAVRRPEAGSRRIPTPPGAIGNVVIVLSAMALLACLDVSRQVARSRVEAAEQAARAAAVDWFRQRTPPDAVIVTGNCGYFFLATERKSVPFVPQEDPVTSYYPADRKLRYCGLGTTAGELRAFERLLETRLLDYYQTAGVTHVLVPEIAARRASIFRDFQRRTGDVFAPVGQVDGYRLYRVSLATSAAAGHANRRQ